MHPKANAGKDWHLYGGRGICVCPSWLHSFASFLADMGERPVNKTLDRRDNDEEYCKSNCRYADAVSQTRNQRRKS